ncbi:hypothetical protein C7379_10152 [Hallella colorans]|uniref:Uncharacterized protein n=1 Tax=Hallella colorans TaxID=1703337 RepID=A0A2U0UNR9_9BACT|nr:hypothetical protein C7379_10152 [Hallella colorans]
MLIFRVFEKNLAMVWKYAIYERDFVREIRKIKPWLGQLLP